MSTTISTSGSTRYRSRTPGPGEEPRRDGVPGLGNSSDCIYSLGESLNGLELFRCPSPPSNGGGVWTAGLKRYGGTEFDTYCLQQGLSRNNLLGGLPLNLEYESLPRGSSMIGPHLFGEFFVNLRRETNGFGFKLLGGLEEGTQVTIGSLAPGGAAERSGQMRAGDRLVSVNGARVFGGTHARALELLERAAETHGEVTLGLWRSSPPVPNSNSTSGSTESSETRCWPSTQPSKTSIRSVLLQRNSGEEGFGFVLANLKSSTSRHPGDHFIARVVPGSASDRSRLLHVGDRLISVNGVNVTNLPREEVIRLVKSSGSQLALSFLPHSAPAMPSYEQMQFYNSQLSHNQQQEQYQHHQKARAVFFQVTLFRSSRGFGFSIRGGHEFNQMPLTVLRVAEGGPAYLDGRLKVGDELLQINGFMTAGMSHRRAVEIIQAGGNMIRLGVRRLLPPLLPPQITTSSDVKYQSPPPPMSYAPFPPPMPALNSSPVPPNLRLPQLFTPLPVHKAPSSSQRALLSPGKLFLFQTFVKLTCNRRNVTPQKKEGYLKDYYRNFRYVPEKGKFQMDSDSSDDEKDNGLRNFRPEYDIGWSPAPDNQDQTPDIYRSIAGLPKDLEYLLKKADDENLDDGELTQLRSRLEQMESQMTRLLEAVNASASTLSQKACYSNVRNDHAWNEDTVEELFSAEEDNDF
ncbi:unnamed protein product [Hymenolepis diminuta]|uniref:PDZ domain-containing protein n=1 Tax=Hymenolepis diminuta TaxID=6216 RepID=A0A158QCJ8_HYMDI|nr:unnamed protein product [Hymenolepis diminuta]